MHHKLAHNTVSVQQKWYLTCWQQLLKSIPCDCRPTAGYEDYQDSIIQMLLPLADGKLSIDIFKVLLFTWA